MTRALWISAESPDPRLSGGSIRLHHMLSALAERVPTDLLLVCEQMHGAPVAELLSSVTELPSTFRQNPGSRWGSWALNAYLALRRIPREVFVHATTRATIEAWLSTNGGSWDVVLVEHGYLAPLARRLARPGQRTVLTLQHVPSVAAGQQADVEKRGRRRWLAGREASAWRRLESRAGREFDVVVAVSDEDAAHLQGTVVVAPNGVECNRFADVTEERTGTGVLFLGHLNFPPNIDGLEFLATDIWPKVTSQHDASLQVVGRDPQDHVRTVIAGMARTTLHADVPDVGLYLDACAVAVVPLRFGTGTRLKALEALASGVPLVGTSIGLAGLGIVDGVHALVRDTPEGLAQGIVDILADPALGHALASAGQRLARTSFDWKPLGESFTDAVLTSLPRHGGTPSGDAPRSSPS